MLRNPELVTYQNSHRQTGFTIIEIVMVIVIMAIISSVGIVRFWGNNKDFQARQFADETVSALRYAQKLAISSGCHILVSFDVNQFKLRQRDPAGCTDTAEAFNIDIIDPTLNTSTEYFRPGSVSWQFFTIDNDTGATTGIAPPDFYYDTLGRPVDSGTNTPYRNQALKIDIGTGLTNVFIESETGFVHL